LIPHRRNEKQVQPDQRAPNEKRFGESTDSAKAVNKDSASGASFAQLSEVSNVWTDR
jgi:hypothetical protein